MKLQNLTIIFIIIILPIILLVSLYINTGLKTIRYQALYDTGLLTATQDAIQAFETNTQNNKYSDNPEEKRSIIKSSVKMFETSLCNTCNISTYNKDEIEDYIPAILFGMYDGFYLYAPSLNPNTDRYEHSLKNYVYYSEILDEDKAVVITYSLDSYVKVSGYFSGTYESREGFLINANETEIEYNAGGDITKIEYYGQKIDMSDEWAVNYFRDNYDFSNWFLNIVKIGEIKDYLNISNTNDPEDPNSAFVQHKNKIIREKIENVLNSSITAYSERTWGQNYKMPELTEEDWGRIYTDISLTTFFQGKRIGLTKYNGYCVLNSNNHYEFINPNLLYFSTDDGGESAGINNPDGKINSSYDYYHDIRCSAIEDLSSMPVKTEPGEIETERTITTLRGWKIGRFRKVKIEKDESGNPINIGTTSTSKTGPQLEYQDYNTYMYERAECGCYLCINGSVNTNVSVYEYISVAKELEGTTDNVFLKRSYWTSLARERARLHVEEPEPNFEVTKTAEDPKKVINGGEITYTITVTNNAPMAENINISDIVSSSGDKIESHRIIEWKLSTSAVGGGYYTTTSEQIKVFSSEGCNVWLAEGQTLTIKYVAKITDLSGDNLVTNTVTATVVRGGTNYPPKSKSVTCETVNSDLEVIKTLESEGVEIANSKDNPVSDKVLEHGSTVKYIVKITNKASLTDKIIIEDWFDRNKITDVDASRIKIKGKLPDDVYSANERHLIWEEIYITSGETITIEFEAKLKGELGSDIINRVKAESLYTGYSVDGENSVQCRTEKKVKLASMSKTLENVNVIFVVDDSLSQLDVSSKVEDIVNDAINKCANLYTGYTVDPSLMNVNDPTDNNRLWVIDYAGSAIFLNINKDRSGKLSINLDTPLLDIYQAGGTDYDSALYLTSLVTRNDMDNIIIFLSDGAPTLAGWDGSKTGIWAIDLFVNTLLNWGSTITSAWGEVAMIDEDEYALKLLAIDIVYDIINFIDPFNLINIDAWYPLNKSTAEALTWGRIKDKVEMLKGNPRNKIYTVYSNFNGKDINNTPEYGMRYISSNNTPNTDEGFHSTIYNPTELENVIDEILEGNSTTISDIELISTYGVIDVPDDYKMDTIEVTIKDDADNVLATYTPTTDTYGIISTSENKIYINKLPYEFLNKNIIINAEID